MHFTTNVFSERGPLPSLQHDTLPLRKLRNNEGNLPADESTNGPETRDTNRVFEGGSPQRLASSSHDSIHAFSTCQPFIRVSPRRQAQVLPHPSKACDGETPFRWCENMWSCVDHHHHHHHHHPSQWWPQATAITLLTSQTNWQMGYSELVSHFQTQCGQTAFATYFRRQEHAHVTFVLKGLSESNTVLYVTLGSHSSDQKLGFHKQVRTPVRYSLTTVGFFFQVI